MNARRADLACRLYLGAFSGEVVFEIRTMAGESYEGIAPKHYAMPAGALSKDPVTGRIAVRVLDNGGKCARVMVPDGEVLSVPAETLQLK